LLLPLEHNEDKTTQELCLTKFTEYYEESKGSEFEGNMNAAMKYSVMHKEVVDIYGRFPKRNAILGRPNTPKEEEDLKAWKYLF